MSRSAHLLSLVCVAAGFMLSGCGNTPFSGSASMRVEVEVYKGPLSRDPETQLGEYVAVLDEASRGFDALLFQWAQEKRDLNPDERETIEQISRLEVELHDAQRRLSALRIGASAWYRDFFAFVDPFDKTHMPPPYERSQSRQILPQVLADLDLGVVAQTCAAQSLSLRVREAIRQPSGATIQRVSNALEACGVLSDWRQKLYQLAIAVDTNGEFPAIEVPYWYGVRLLDVAPKAFANLRENGTFQICASERIPALIAESEGDLTTASVTRVREALSACQSRLAQARKPNDPPSAVEMTIADGGVPTEALRVAVSATSGAFQAVFVPANSGVTKLRQEDLVENQISALRASSPLDLSKPGAVRDRLVDHLVASGQVAQGFRAKAQFWSYTNIAYQKSTVQARRATTTLSALLAAYADRVGQRADTLLQMLRGNDRHDFPLSIALRETSPSAYLRQYVWNRAVGDVRAIFDDGARDRVRAIEQLSGDDNWTNINTVYASGRGTVRMALIKDDIGNWNLKSFDQDPTKLLEAYRNVGLAALKGATDIASQIAAPGGATALSIASGVADRLAFGAKGDPEPLLGNDSIVNLRTRVIDRLNQISKQAKERDDQLVKDIDTQTPKVTAAKSEKESAGTNETKARAALTEAADKATSQQRDDYAKAIEGRVATDQKFNEEEGKLNLLQARRKDLPRLMVDQAQGALRDYEQLLLALQSAAVQKNGQAGPAQKKDPVGSLLKSPL